jgi:hypothetical protein
VPFQRRTEGGGLAAPYVGGGVLTCYFDIAEREGGSLRREEGGAYPEGSIKRSGEVLR